METNQAAKSDSAILPICPELVPDTKMIIVTFISLEQTSDLVEAFLKHKFKRAKDFRLQTVDMG